MKVFCTQTVSLRCKKISNTYLGDPRPPAKKSFYLVTHPLASSAITWNIGFLFGLGRHSLIAGLQVELLSVNQPRAFTLSQITQSFIALHTTLRRADKLLIISVINILLVQNHLRSSSFVACSSYNQIKHIFTKNLLHPNLRCGPFIISRCG